MGLPKPWLIFHSEPVLNIPTFNMYFLFLVHGWYGEHRVILSLGSTEVFTFEIKNDCPKFIRFEGATELPFPNHGCWYSW